MALRSKAFTDCEARGYGAETTVALKGQNCGTGLSLARPQMDQYVQFNHQVLSANISEVTAIVYSVGCHEAAAGSSVVGRPFVAEDGGKLDFL